ncbi:tryptophan halogenase family protein [Sphingorhabdus arenilitoris]|uniref:Tryptophan halogenase family protein n=1 Tax=Sphingorhabdus arenilitoris TaxID=1490041 RepID=A0ABV8RIL1_9SPHN
MTAEKAFRFVILGGGSAGWITANLFAHHWRGKNVEIQVVESPDIGIIGVGEGSTPQLKAFFDQLNISESLWMPACDATYKIGIRFAGWSHKNGYDSYFHPFPAPLDMHSEPSFIRNAAMRRAGIDVPAHPDSFYLSPHLAAQRSGPHPSDNFPFELSYGYHFDAYKLGDFLRGHAASLGVRHIPMRIEDVIVGDDGNVDALLGEEGQRIDGDFFVDCSGFRAIINEKALGAPYIPFADNLFNNRAVVMPTPPDLDAAGSAAIATGATAMNAGWRWSIPLTQRHGNGYVYSDKYIDPDAAETELRAALDMLDSDVSARHLQMRVGRLADSWSANSLAMGLSQGFIEPLEATAIHIVIATAQQFMAAFDDGEFGPKNRDIFNQRIAARYEGIRDYIVAHYRLNQRGDNDYWRDNAANDHLSDNLKAMMTAWFTGKDMAAEIARLNIGNYYGNISWHCLFAGYGVFPDSRKLRAPLPHEGAADMVKIAHFMAGAARNFGSHKASLDRL